MCRSWSRAGLAWGSLRYGDACEIHRVESFGQFARRFVGSFSEPCFLVSGDVVFGPAELNELISLHSADPAKVVSLLVAGDGNQPHFSAGPLAKLLTSHRDVALSEQQRHAGLPFSVGTSPTGGPDARRRLAQSLARETARTDGLLARVLDRKVSWRISRRLAETRITANQVTLANTALGLLAGFLFASTSYPLRVAGSLLFLLSITLDGVDGEIARLKLQESEAGARLDVITDNVVNVAIFIGVFIGSYRATGSVAYFYLLPVLLLGFALCALAVRNAVRDDGPRTHDWVDKVERVAGRDFGYLLFALAALNRLQFFAWGTAFGTYVFAAVLTLLTRCRALRERAIGGRAPSDTVPISGAHLTSDPAPIQGHAR